MRPIKFRGKRKGGQEWLFGDLNHIDGKVYIFDRSEIAPTNSTDWFEVDPETVGQFTGLLAKDGKEIWEGDIMEVLCDWGKYMAEIKFPIIDSSGDYHYAFGYEIYDALGEKEGFYLSLTDFAQTQSVIIGNVHDNPDLLT